MKVCNRCKEPKPITDFGVNNFYATRGAKDGRSIWCRLCLNASVAARREDERARKALEPKLITAPKKKPTPTQRVYGAVNNGYRTREAIRRATGLGRDTVCDVLAQLAFDAELIKVVKVGERKEFHLVAA